MESELLKVLATLGSSGVVGVILWLISKRYMDAHAAQVQITFQVQDKRIETVEKHHQECEGERREQAVQVERLHQELLTVLREQHRPTIEGGRSHKIPEPD